MLSDAVLDAAMTRSNTEKRHKPSPKGEPAKTLTKHPTAYQRRQQPCEHKRHTGSGVLVAQALQPLQAPFQPGHMAAQGA
jgi:hypothetical protein